VKRWDGNGVVVETSDAVTPRVLEIAPPGSKRRGVKAADDALDETL
jgi:hypothetical protein